MSTEIFDQNMSNSGMPKSVEHPALLSDDHVYQPRLLFPNHLNLLKDDQMKPETFLSSSLQ